MKKEQPVSREASREPTERPQQARPYRTPELEEYGRLKDLTRTLSTQVPGDAFGGSYAT